MAFRSHWGEEYTSVMHISLFTYFQGPFCNSCKSESWVVCEIWRCTYRGDINLEEEGKQMPATPILQFSHLVNMSPRSTGPSQTLSLEACFI